MIRHKETLQYYCSSYLRVELGIRKVQESWEGFKMNGTFEKEEIIVGWRKMCSVEPHELYFSPNFIRVIKSVTIDWPASRMLRMDGNRNACV
jgi:hypothetical protein